MKYQGSQSRKSIDSMRVTMKVVLWLWLAGTSVLYSSLGYAITSIERHGITWSFKDNIPEGQYGYFANGDPWVVGPVVITSISPGYSGGRNGSMINPLPNSSAFGFDSRYGDYTAQANIGAALPYTVQPGSSVVSTISQATTSGAYDPYIMQLDVLTVLASPASSGDFRPPYLGHDKSLKWNISELDYALLPSLAPVSGAPSLSTVETYFEYPWVELITDWTGRFYHAKKNHPTGEYGREMTNAAGSAMLSLALDYSNAEKSKLFIGIVQAGIDIYGAASLGARWNADGGNNQGRKMIMLLAGKALGDQSILSLADGSKKIFQEDQQTFYVSQAEVNLTNSSGWKPDARHEVAPYTSAHIGLPEWGIRHYQIPAMDNAAWDAMYRGVAGGCTFSHFVVAKLLGVENEWNWPAFFDYYVRYFNEQWPDPHFGVNGISTFAANMYLGYLQTGDYEIPDPPIDNAGDETITSPPIASLNSGYYYGTQSLALTSNTADSVIYYTLDGSVPTVDSTIYTQPIQISSSVVVNSFAQSTDHVESSVISTDLKLFDSTTSETIPTTSNWENMGLPIQNENFSFEFEAMPSALNIDAVVGLANGSAANYTDLGVIVRFNIAGYIDVRNGSLYDADTAVAYQAGVTYKFKVLVNLTEATYSVYLEQDGETTALAVNYNFRTEQADLTSIDSLSFIQGVGVDPVSIGKFEFGPFLPVASPPNPPLGVTISLH